MTKTMTATLLALYDRRGLVHIPPPGGSLAGETKLQDLLPSGYVLPARRKTITLEQLADQHAGLPRKPDAKIDNGTYAQDLDALYKDVCTCPIACPPGGVECPCGSPPCACKPPAPSSEAGEYSNFGYAVLGDVLAPLHAPGAPGFRAYIGFVPSRSIGVVVLANCDVDAETIGRQTLSQL